MNVYDFDNTILRGDSTALFCMYCARRYPRLWLQFPAQAVNGLLFALKIRKKQAFKQRLLSFVAKIDDIDAAIDGFWAQAYARIKPFYAQTHRADDLIISASPEFLIAPACARLGVRCMGSPVDKRTGAFHGANCHGAEKVRRFREIYPDAQIDDFYSDSYSDDPLARLSHRAFLVKGDRLLLWGKDR